ncbi:MAG: 4-hydroxy-tetrahydrodipicolinate reductase [Dehalococcoidia bacterium]|nr:4-hydroxy-tetrahydrodipicolinate reductase [Dehalococcoidia bacterium]
MKSVIVSGLGKMGTELIRTIEESDKFETISIIEPMQKITKYKTKNQEYPVFQDPAEAFVNKTADVVVDFTNAEFTKKLAPLVFDSRMSLVVGTSNLSQKTIDYIKKTSNEKKLGCVVASNFALGAVLMMYFSEKAAPFYNVVEIIESHHDQKIDSPSGTAMDTAQRIVKNAKNQYTLNIAEQEKIKNARGANFDGVSLHSVRLPGVIANQEVMFSAADEVLSIEHKTIGRKSFMPGIIMAIEYASNNNNFLFGLEEVIGIN